MAKRSKTEERVDTFLPFLQRNIHTLQDERTQALRQIEALKSRVSGIDGELEVLEYERTQRTRRPLAEIPDFPPPQREVPAPPQAEVEKEEEVPSVEEAAQEDDEYRDWFDNSSLPDVTPGHGIFGPYPGINAPLKSPAYVKATFAVVRDWVENWGKDDWFSPGQIVRDTGFSSTIVRSRLRDLQEKKTVVHNGKEKGGSKFKFNSDKGRGPRNHPTQDTPRSKERGGKPVPHTRAVGRSGKPGLDKKRARAGRKVKRDRQGT